MGLLDPPGLTKAAADGTYGPTAAPMLAAFASKAAALSPVVAGMKSAPYRMLTTFASGHGYTASGSGSVNLNDSAVTVLGSQGITITSDSASANGTIVGKAAQTAMDLSAASFAILVKVADMTTLTSISVQFGDTSFANYANVNALVGSAPGTGPAGLQTRSGEWAWVHFTWADLGNNVGSPTRTAVTDVRLRVAGRGAGAAIVQVAALAYFPKASAYPLGVATFCLDDGYASHRSIAGPALGKYGYPATMFPICNLIGTSGRLSVADLQQLCRINHFEVSGHCFDIANHGGYNTLTPAAVEVDVAANKQWIIDNGLPLADFFAWPSGADTLDSENVVRKYFSGARHTIRAPRATLPPGQPYRVTTLVLDAVISLATAKAEVDSAFTNGTWVVFTAHDVTTGTPTGQQWAASDYVALVDYVAAKGMPVQTFGQVARTLS